MTILSELLKLREAERKKDDDDEKKKKTKTKDKSKPDFDPNSFFNQKKDEPLAHRPSDKKSDDEPGKGAKFDPDKASRDETGRASRNVDIGDEGRRHLGNMRNIHDDDATDDDLGVRASRSRSRNPSPNDDEVRPDEPEFPVGPHAPRDLPKVISNAVQGAGFENPKFHVVANLPGNIARPIRTLGRHLFASFTRTPTDEISMIGNLGGNGPNTKKEVDAVASFLKKHGQDLGDGEIDFDNVMPGYTAQIRRFRAIGTLFMVVKDFAGEYIYAWPEEDTKGHNPAQLGNDKKEAPRLSHKKSEPEPDDDDDLFNFSDEDYERYKNDN